MNKLTHIIKTGVFVLLTSLSIASCTDGNDWETTTGNRLFGSTSFSVEAAAITANVSWNSTPNTEYYVLEASLEPMNDDMAMGSVSGSIVFGSDKSIKKSPYTLTGLVGETTYYLRLKSMAAGKESRWIYLEGETFKTTKEEALGTVPTENITEESILLTWQAGLEVTHVIVKAGIDAPIRKDINTEEAAAGQILIDGLAPGTEYVISIYNGEIKRGETTVMTVMPVMAEFTSVQATKSSVEMTWDPEAIVTGSTTVSHYAWCEGSRTPSTSDHYTALTDEQISQGQLEITSLEPSTTYTVALMRGSYIRAMKTFTTSKGIPSGYTKVVVTSATEWNDALANNSGKVAILLTGDMDITGASKTIPNTITSLLVWGANEAGDILDTKPSIKAQQLCFNGTFTQLEFFNLNLWNTATGSGSGTYFIDQNSVSATFDNLLLESCKVTGYRGLIRVRSNNTGNWNRMELKDCIVTVYDYGLFALEGTATKYGIIALTNTTLDNSYKILKSASADFTINMNQCTIYGAGATLIEGPTTGTIKINISNSLFGGIVQQAYNSTASITTAGIVQTNSFRTSDCTFAQTRTFGDVIEGVTNAQLFTAPASGNYVVLKDEYKQYGDPRWNK